MPELIINGPAGRIEARYHHEPASDSPIALILHPHPQFGGTMNNQVVYSLYYTFAQRAFRSSASISAASAAVRASGMAAPASLPMQPPRSTGSRP